MRNEEMSSRSAKDKQTFGRRQSAEEEPFIVEEIPGSPVIRGRRHIPEEEHFVVENIPGSAVTTGRREHSEGERFVIQDIPRSPVARGKNQNFERERFSVEHTVSNSPVTRARGSRLAPTRRTLLDSVDTTINGPVRRLTSNMVSNSTRNTTTTTSNVSVNDNRQNGSPDEDAPPSYESSIPPNHIGWSANVTSPFPMPYSTGHNAEISTFAYQSSCPYPPMELSPMVKSYLSMESPNSKSPEPSLSPSPSPNPERLRPAYTYEFREPVVTIPARPQFTREHENNGNIAPKRNDDVPYRHGGIIVAGIFVVLMILLLLLVQFLMRNHRGK